MIELVMKFVEWIKDAVVMIVGLPGRLASYLSLFSDLLWWLPNGLGDTIMGLIATAIMIFMVYAIVKLVTSLL